MYRRLPLRIAAAGAVLLAACSGDLNSPAPTSPDLQLQNLQSSESPSQEQLDRQIPGFGGYFLDRTGTPTVYLQAGARRGPAEQALAAVLSARGLAPERLQVLTAAYSYRQLERWFQQASPEALAVTGAVFVDNDEASNRVRIGVEHLSAQANVNAAVARLGIPAGAVIIEQTQPIVQLATLQNVVDRPVRAGVQINFPGYLCSVGFNATLGTQQSFVTASHCTNTQGGTEGTPYWQPLQSVDGTQIATEVDDPVYFKNQNGCPRGRKCRYSDASRAAYVNGANQALGLIAATSGPNNGSLTITGSLSIGSDDCNSLGGCLVSGSTVGKIGRTTGWTAGVITNTCVNTGVQGSQIVQLCQTFVSAGVGGGDSGSDVFQGSGPTVKLAGVLWGGSSSGNQFVFSPLGNVFRELGTLTTH
jgi:hypothetical protein